MILVHLIDVPERRGVKRPFARSTQRGVERFGFDLPFAAMTSQAADGGGDALVDRRDVAMTIGFDEKPFALVKFDQRLGLFMKSSQTRAHRFRFVIFAFVKPAAAFIANAGDLRRVK